MPLDLDRILNIPDTPVAKEKKAIEDKKIADKAKIMADAKAKADAEALRLAQAEQARLDAIVAEKARIRALWVAGNDYTFGNCTWYVANRRDVPPTMGNARSWLYSAQAIGMQTGPTPEIGAIAWTYPGWTLGHVAYVEEVYPDGTFLISEMNYVGYNMISTRVVTTDGWYFIY